tara:strand:- start:164 stop:367 length:204 start_codon:yes stop_codon:yes gene_type:complete
MRGFMYSRSLAVIKEQYRTVVPMVKIPKFGAYLAVIWQFLAKNLAESPQNQHPHIDLNLPFFQAPSL